MVRGFCLNASVTALLTTGCATPASQGTLGDGLVVYVQIPAGSALPVSDPQTYRSPHPGGSRIAIWDPGRPQQPPRVLSQGFWAAGSPVVSPDARMILFTGKRERDEPSGIYEIPLTGGRARRVSPEGFSSLHPAYLAGGRIVFSADGEGATDPMDGKPAYSLYTCALDGSGLQRITFNPGSDIEPTVLRDGRVLYAAWQYPGPDRPEGGWALFTVRHDGTGLFPLYGSHGEPYWKRAPREVGGGRVTFVASSRGSSPESSLRTVSLRRPMKSLGEISGAEGSSWRSASPWRGDSLLAAIRPPTGTSGQRPTFGLYIVDLKNGEPGRRLLDDPEFDEVEGVLAEVRPAPRGHISSVRAGEETGTLLCLDARRTNRPDSQERLLPASRIRIYRGYPLRGGTGGAAPHRSGASSPIPLPQELILDVPLADDGSFLVDVPADTPLRFETRDSSGQTLLDSKGWAWVRPGEKRSCIGCHEDREVAPPNRFPLALTREAPPPGAGQVASVGGAP